MQVALDDRALRANLDERVHQRLAPLFAALSLSFLFFAIVTLALRPQGATAVLAAVDGAGAVLLGLGAWILWRRGDRPPLRHANAIATTAFLLTLGASLLAIALLDLPSQTTNVLLVQLVASVILLGPRFFAVILAASLAGWVAVAWTRGWGDAWLNAGFALAVTSFMSFTIQWLLVREARASAQLIAANELAATRLAAAAEKEREHVKALMDANASLQAFSFVVSHDLKEPVRGMRILLEELRDDLDAPEREGLIRRALESHRQLEQLMNGLLEWSRVATITPELEPVDVRALLDDPTTRSVFDRALHEKRVTLLVAQEIPFVHASVPLLRQALANLILNAAKHNDRADLQIRVYAAADAPVGAVDVIVEDNGTGFPERLLQSGLDVQPRSLTTGFGIAIARRATQRMGGRLQLRNREDHDGAQAHVLLPAGVAAAPARPAPGPRASVEHDRDDRDVRQRRR